MNRISKKAIRTALALSTMAVFLDPLIAAARPAGYSDNTVKIGVLTDLSGIYSDVGGMGSVIAAQMAAEDFQAQYKPTFKIEVISGDHQNRADIGATKAREWFDQKGVDMITDVINSAVALAVTKVATEKNKIVMVTGAGTTRLTNEDCAPNNIVHYGWDTKALVNGHARTQAAKGANSWFFISVDYALGRALEAEATEAVKDVGGSVIGSVKHPFNASDFSSFMLQAQASKAKVIGIANGGGDLINAIKSANEFGVKKNQTLIGLAATFTDVNALGLNNAQGMFLVEDFYWDLNDATRAWSRRFLAKYKKMPNMIHAGTYSAVMTYLKAAQAVGTDAPADVMKKLHQTAINDMFAANGKIRADGRMVHDMYLMEVKKPNESKAPWDYYTVRSTIPGDQAFQSMALSKCAAIKK